MERAAISFSRGSSWSRNRTQAFCIADRFFTDWATRETKQGWKRNVWKDREKDTQDKLKTWRHSRLALGRGLQDFWLMGWLPARWVEDRPARWASLGPGPTWRSDSRKARGVESWVQKEQRLGAPRRVPWPRLTGSHILGAKFRGNRKEQLGPRLCRDKGIPITRPPYCDWGQLAPLTGPQPMCNSTLVQPRDGEPASQRPWALAYCLQTSAGHQAGLGSGTRSDQAAPCCWGPESDWGQGWPPELLNLLVFALTLVSTGPIDVKHWMDSSLLLARVDCVWGAATVEQTWVMRVGWDPGGKKCCRFQRRKMRGSANSFLVTLTSTFDGKIV